ncbi:ISL3 family transposase [Catalinimonas sp. 4WD22]|uniref:ISL3 family transposase n=1 Tax=Catalinimonas locisalis TaxID=3133978 RepID=UPI003100CD65
MNIDSLLPPISGLQLLGANFQERHIFISLKSSHSFACCPLCHNSSSRIHSHYSRTVADLPWADRQVVLELNVRRFFCDYDSCSRKIFTERLGGTPLHPSIAAYARRTARLDHYLETLALLLGGEGAALLAYLLNISTISADTLLNLTRKIPTITFDTPKILGIDEWSIRKGKTYATILVDLENRRPVDLLPDAKSDTVEAWLKEHPGVEIISRDRDTVFAEGARRGAPDAIQVADRWHLLKNLGDALKKMLEANPAGLRATAAALLGLPTLSGVEEEEQVQEQVAKDSSLKDVSPELTTKSNLRHQHVRELRAKGWSIKAIARHFKMHRQTVKRYMALNVLPKKSYSHHMNAKGALTQDQKNWITRRWTEDGLNANQIFKELKQQGYKGSASCIYRYVAHFSVEGKVSQSPQKARKRGIPPYSAPKAMWLMVKPEDQLPESKQKQLKALLENHAQAGKSYPLVQQFISMVKYRKSEDLDKWIKEAKECDIIQMQRFAQGLERDYQAVKAGLTLEWSNGQVEGQITRLKFIKRQGYGRANLDLLKKRVMYKLGRGAA